MLVDSTSKDTEIKGVNVDSFETENQGTSLYSVLINYDTNSIPFIAEVKAKCNQRAQGTRDFPHDGELSMRPTNSQRQKKIITTKKGLRKSGVAKLGGMYGEEKQIRQKREGRTWEDDVEPENPDCKRARFDV